MMNLGGTLRKRKINSKRQGMVRIALGLFFCLMSNCLLLSRYI